ncbi:YsnF/AvaK domain-containing protein [Phormidesmis sp. 146-12]
MALGRQDNMMSNQRAVGVFPTRQAAEQALHELRDSGFSMDKVSVINKNADHRDGMSGAEVSDRVGNKADEGAGVGAVSGGALGGLTGLLVGLGTLAIPGVGPIMLAGATATALATTAAGGAIGAAAGSLLGGLVGLGIPEAEAKHYNDRITQGGYLVIVDGTQDDIRRAGAILSHRGITDWAVYGGSSESRIDAMPVAPVATPVQATRQTAPTTDAESINLYEERLVVDKDREKTGEVAIGKHVETETARVSVPIEKERVVIERTTPVSAEAVVPGEMAFQSGETVRVEVYEETPDIHKEAFVREEVTIRKEVEQETVTAQETLRREELEIDTEGRPVVNADRNLNDRI